MKASDFLALASLRRSTVDVGGKTLNIREMSVRERAEFLSISDKTAALVPPFLVKTCVLNEDGSQMFSEADAKALAESSPGIIDQVATAVMELSRLNAGEDAPNA